MTDRHADEVVLARWTVDAARVRAFAAAVRARYGTSPYLPRELVEACEADPRAGIEVVFRDDAVFVGRWCLAFLYNGISGFRLEEPWILFEMEGGEYDIPIPTAADNRAEEERIVATYRAMAAEETRRYLEARAAPTLNNRLLNIAERHFVWVVLGLFFVVIPALVLLVGWLRGGLE